VQEELRAFPRHWDAEMAGMAGEADANLDQTDVDLERISPNVRYGRRFRQSEVPEALDILAHAKSCLDRARDTVGRLETERRRIAEVREQFDQELGVLLNRTLPAVEATSTQMLPELQRRFAQVRDRLAREAATLSDPAQANYDQANDEWLPAAQRELASIDDEHQDNVTYYRDMVQDALRRIDRQWSRLSKLQPQQKPGPEGDARQLAADLDAWRVRVEQHLETPLDLREDARRAGTLEQRIDKMQREIVEGRRNLDAIERQYRRRAQTVDDLSDSIEDLRTRSAWPLLVWASDEAEETKERAISLAEESHRAENLVEAGNRLQQALNISEEAEGLLARVEREMASGLRRLDDELRSIENGLRRVDRDVDALREQGPSDELTMLEEASTAARRSIERAQSTTDFEEALRYLREAANSVGRVLLR
jgi:hypothetical protein